MKPAAQRSGSSCARIEREALTGGSNDEAGNRVTVVFRKPADCGSRPGAPGGCVGRRRERQPEDREAGEDGEAGQAGKAWPLTGTALRAGRRTNVTPGAADLRRAVFRLVSRLKPATVDSAQ